MNPAIVEAKTRWRRELRQRLRTLAPETREPLSQQIRRRLIALPEWTQARRVLLFHSLPEEPDVLPLWESLTRAGKITAFPAYLAATETYVARVAGPWSPGASLPHGAFGIPEPPADSPTVPGNQLDFVVVPGLGFDLAGRRLGRGRGFYDRLLTGVKGFCCGVGFDEQLVDELPAEPHDRRVDGILTPSREWFDRGARA